MNFGGRRATTVAAISLLQGTIYEFIPVDSLVEIGLITDTTGLIASIFCDNEVALQDNGETNVTVRATGPIYPDDFWYSFSCIAGSRLVISVRGVVGVVFWGGRITPV